jgi:hypothetical protein
VRNLKYKATKEIFKMTLKAYHEGNPGFNPTFLQPDIMIKPKVDWITEVIRQQACSNKKCIAIVDRDLFPHIEDSWS